MWEQKRGAKPPQPFMDKTFKLTPHLMINGVIHTPPTPSTDKVLSTTPTSSGVTQQLSLSNREIVGSGCVHSDNAAFKREADAHGLRSQVQCRTADGDTFGFCDVRINTSFWDS